MGPVSRLPCRSNVCRFLRLASCVGMLPVSRFSRRANHCRLERLTSAEGILPVSPLLGRFNPVTRELRTMTPSHWLMERYTLQLSDALPCREALRPRRIPHSLIRLETEPGMSLTAKEQGFCAATGAGLPTISSRPVSTSTAQKKVRADRRFLAEYCLPLGRSIFWFGMIIVPC